MVCGAGSKRKERGPMKANEFAEYMQSIPNPAKANAVEYIDHWLAILDGKRSKDGDTLTYSFDDGSEAYFHKSDPGTLHTNTTKA